MKRYGLPAVLAAAAAVVWMAWAWIPERGMDEDAILRVMKTEPAAVYDFMGGTLSVYESGSEYLGAILWPQEDEQYSGRVEFGSREMPAEEYYALYGDTEYMPYSPEEKAYVGEMGDLWHTRAVPTHVFPMRCLQTEDGIAFVWMMSRSDFDALDAERVVAMEFDGGGSWSAALELRQ